MSRGHRSEKHGKLSVFKVSRKLIAMLSVLPKSDEKVFGCTSLNGLDGTLLAKTPIGKKASKPES